MRQVKFRYWNGNKVLNQEAIINHLNKYIARNDKHLMQFTGLFDKQGVEIYEGDIVKGSAYGKEIYTGVVEFYDASFVMRIDGNKGYYRLNKMTFQELGVIGSIYKNPELSKEAK